MAVFVAASVQRVQRVRSSTSSPPPLPSPAALQSKKPVAACKPSQPASAYDADGLKLKLRTAAEVEYRLKRVDISRGDGIDAIKMTYDDDSIWCHGHDGGKVDNRPLILTDGEHVVKVVHETFKNHKTAAASVDFETNKGRVFQYHPTQLTTRWESELTTVTAQPGHEIIGLTIRHGTLVGSEQQPASSRLRAKDHRQWFAVGTTSPKEDDDADAATHTDDDTAAANKTGTRTNTTTDTTTADTNTNTGSADGAATSSTFEGITFKHYFSKAGAEAAWRAAAAHIAAKPLSRGGIFVDCSSLTVLKTAGEAAAIVACKTAGIGLGLSAPKRDEDVDILDAVWTLYKLLGTRKDAVTFMLVTALIVTASYFDLAAKVLLGDVLTQAAGQNLTAAAEAVEANTWSAAMCRSGAVTCTGPTADPRKVLIVTLLAIRFLERFAYVLNVWFHHFACDSRNKVMKAKAFSHVLGLDQGFFDTHTTSEIQGSMNVHAINNLISWNIPYLFALSLKIAMVAYFLISINVWLGVFSISGALVTKFAILDPISSYEKKIHRIKRKLDIFNTQMISEALEMIQSVKLFSKEEQHQAEYMGSQDRILGVLATEVNLRCIREFIYGMAKVATFIGVLYFALGDADADGTDGGGGTELTASKVTGFFMVFHEFQDLFGRIKWHWDLLHREFSDIERFLELLKVKSAIVDGTKDVGTLHGAIEFKDVQFEYPSRPGEQALKGLNLKIQPNKMTAIVGGSGAGKSTVTKLLMRLYDPTAGSITIDGHDLRDLKVESLHRHIGIVNQTPDLFQGSLADNIRYGSAKHAVDNGEDDEAEILAAATMANCVPFIEKFRAKFDTFAGSKGGQLSGGQKQRIAIARAAIRGSSIMVLDEATSNLDAENERLVQEALENVMQGKTTIVIAHRLSTIQNADEVVCMHDGAVAERGTHAELMAKDGVYANLVKCQLLDK